eukprot:c13440_g1_i2.p1 GENE.c13440_g1_i2~~c13440_g1_i2.p1  ORF type:complete len:273 (+),score=84.60 c13440_g1_i2:83-901(+)
MSGLKILFLFLFECVWLVPGIKIPVQSKEKCIFEKYNSRVLIRGRFNWETDEETNYFFEIRGHPTDHPLYQNHQKNGTFIVKGQGMKFCFKQRAKKSCDGWKQTKDCNPRGTREPKLDQACDKIIKRGLSGYCECIKKSTKKGKSDTTSKKHFTCDHEPFTCKDICAGTNQNAMAFLDFFAEVPPPNYDHVARRENLSPVEEIFSKVSDFIYQIKTDSEEILLEEQEHYQMTEQVNSWVVHSHVGIVIFATTLAMFQAYTLLVLFRKKLLIN